jgi:hypothetical protein
MPDVTSGLEPDELSGLDPDSDAGFAARLAQKVQGDDVTDEAKAAIASLDKGDRSVQAGLQESAPTTPRDDQGRFAPAAQESEEEEEGAAPDEEEQEEDDPIARFIEQHGDEKEAVAAALREKEEAQSLIGRQGNELGETRKREQELAERLARLEGRLEATPAPTSAPPQISRDDLDEWIAGENADGSGGKDAFLWAAENDPRLIPAVFDIWGQYDAHKAAVTQVRYEQNLLRTEGGEGRQESAAQPAQDPILARMHAQERFESSLDEARSTLNDKDWELIKPHMVEAMEHAPEAVGQMVASEDPPDAGRRSPRRDRACKGSSSRDVGRQVRSQGRANGQEEGRISSNGVSPSGQGRQPHRRRRGHDTRRAGRSLQESLSRDRHTKRPRGTSARTLTLRPSGRRVASDSSPLGG